MWPTASALSTPPTQAMLALSPTATELPISFEKLGVIEQVRSPTVIDPESTAATVPFAWVEGAPVLVALVVTVVPPLEVADDTELDEETDEDEETDTETEPGLPGAPEDELAPESGVCLIVRSDRFQHEMAASWPVEKPDTEIWGPI